MNICELCDELAGSPQGKALWPQLIPNRSRILVENEDYVALASIGPIGPGHCLILPKQHCLSMSSISDQKALHEFRWAFEDRLSFRYGKTVLMFEHGTSEDSDKKPCTVSHAHWHFIPSDMPVQELLIPGFTWEPSALPIDNSGGEYLMVGCRDQFWIGKSEQPIQSQILRRTYVEKWNPKVDWDWKTTQNYNVDTVLETLSWLGK